MKRTYGALAVAAIAMMATPAFAQLKIGSAGPMTGQYAAAGEQLRRGVTMAVEEINAAGGVNGQKLELIIGDDACDPKQATAVANKMVSDKVHSWPATSAPARRFRRRTSTRKPKFCRSRRPRPIPSSPTMPSPRATPRCSAPAVVTTCRATVGAYILKHHKNAKIAILHDKSPYGKGVADETKKALNKGGLREAMYEAYNDTDKDFTAIINKMKQHSSNHRTRRPPPAGALIIKRRASRASARRWWASSAETAEFAQLGGAATNGVLIRFRPKPRTTRRTPPW